MRVFGPNARVTSAIRRGSVAIVIVEQCAQPPLVGDSHGSSGYGLCAYASSRACAFAIPVIHATGETPPAEARGAVTPPPTSAPGWTRWMAAYAGFRRR